MSTTSRFSIAAAAAAVLFVTASEPAHADPCRTAEVAAFFGARGYTTNGLEISSWSPGAGQSGATFCRAIVGGKLFVVKYYLSQQQCELEDDGYRAAVSDQQRVMRDRNANSGYPPIDETQIPELARHMFTPYLGKGPVSGACGFTVSTMAPGSRMSDLIGDPGKGIRAAQGLGTYMGLLHRKTASPMSRADALELKNWIAINPPDASLTNLLYSELDGVFVVDWSQRGMGMRTVDILLASIFNQIGTAVLPMNTFDPDNTTQRAALIQALRVASAFWDSYFAQITRPLTEAPMNEMEGFEGVTTGSMSIPVSEPVWASFRTALIRFKLLSRQGETLQEVCQKLQRERCRASSAVGDELCVECERFLTY